MAAGEELAAVGSPWRVPPHPGAVTPIPNLSREALGALEVRRRSALSLRTLRKVQEFVDANLAREFCIDDIAHAAFLSPYHLGRRYREATGESLWQYVLRCRAQRAAALISAYPESKLADIAAQCGFESYGQFIAAFRKTYGFTPGGLRRLLDQAPQ